MPELQPAVIDVKIIDGYWLVKPHEHRSMNTRLGLHLLSVADDKLLLHWSSIF